MSYTRGLIILFIAMVSGCFSPPEFPTTPFIEFNDIIFREVNNQPDSIILSIDFQDGNGDLGLTSIDIRPPYNDIWYFLKSDETLLAYSDRFTPPYDTLPPYEFPYTCLNYAINTEISGYEDDTLYFQQNEDHWNIIIKYFVKKNGIYTEFNWETAFDPQCSDSFNGRFPILSDQDSQNPLEGTLRYGMTSTGFRFLFRNDTLKLRIKIKDRALNVSNEIETPDFVLKDIMIE